MVRLPEEITKGKAVTYKLLKLNRPVSYFDPYNHEKRKFTHAITVCDIPFLYLFENKVNDGRRGLYFSTAVGVGQNTQYNDWWKGSRPNPTGDIERMWVHSDFPAVNYGVEVKIAFRNSIESTNSDIWPNAFWKKAFGGFTKEGSNKNESSGMRWQDVFLMSCQCYTTLVLHHKCLLEVMERTVGKEDAIFMLANHTILAPKLEKQLEVNVMKLLRQGEHTTHTRGTIGDMRAWIHLINTLSLIEHQNKTVKNLGIVNMSAVSLDNNLTAREYYSGLSDARQKKFHHAKVNMSADSLDLWIGYMLSPANTICRSEGGGWGGFTTVEESKRRYALMWGSSRR